jgi:hypothetical protein
VSSINSLGISLGNEVDNGLENIKTLDLNSLLEASKTKLNKDKQECSNEDDASETDSDLDLDQDAIQHLVGDIADEIFGEQGSQNLDFKPTPRRKKLKHNKKKKSNQRAPNRSKRSKMNGMFWNSNGLTDQAKPRFLFNSVNEHHLDFIAISESKRADFNQPELAHYYGTKDFKWSWTQPRGRSGGILVGVNLEKLLVQGIVHDNFLLKFKLKNMDNNFEWTLIAVYGAA